MEYIELVVMWHKRPCRISTKSTNTLLAQKYKQHRHGRLCRCCLYFCASKVFALFVLVKLVNWAPWARCDESQTAVLLRRLLSHASVFVLCPSRASNLSTSDHIQTQRLDFCTSKAGKASTFVPVKQVHWEPAIIFRIGVSTSRKSRASRNVRSCWMMRLRSSAEV